MADQNALQKLFQLTGCLDFRWIVPAEIVVAEWVRLKCAFGCESYGRNAACPPNTPPLAECRTFFREYRLGVLFRFQGRGGDPEDHHELTRRTNLDLLRLESAVSAAGYPRTFLLFLDSCNFCKDCAKSRSSCRNKKMARPSPEGMGVDVAATAARFNFPQLPSAGTVPFSYAILLLE